MIRSDIDAREFGQTVAELFPLGRTPELVPSRPNVAVLSRLQGLTTEKLFPGGVKDEDMALACLAGLWLYHDFLDESHKISQEIETPTGSYWHGIMHRREPDYENAKYWFRRVGQHPVLQHLGGVVTASEAIGEPIPKHLAKDHDPSIKLDSFALVNWCQACAGKGDREEEACRRVQQIEIVTLFCWCWEQARKPD
jgi:hypothetical protein